MSDLCQSLEAEHRVIERVLDALQKEAARVEGGAAANPDFFESAIAFVKEFADGVHHQKEESILFPRMAEAGIPEEGGPVGCMLAEHEEGRAFIRCMSACLKAAATGDVEARRELVEATRGYVELLRAHIQKEDGILFPMADQVFDDAQKGSITQAFADAEVAHEAVTAKRKGWAESLA